MRPSLYFKVIYCQGQYILILYEGQHFYEFMTYEYSKMLAIKKKFCVRAVTKHFLKKIKLLCQDLHFKKFCNLKRCFLKKGAYIPCPTRWQQYRIWIPHFRLYPPAPRTKTNKIKENPDPKHEKYRIRIPHSRLYPPAPRTKQVK